MKDLDPNGKLSIWINTAGFVIENQVGVLGQIILTIIMQIGVVDLQQLSLNY